MARSPLAGAGVRAARADYHLPPGLRSRIAALFEEDRQLLRGLAGAEAAEWPARDVVPAEGPVAPR